MRSGESAVQDRRRNPDDDGLPLLWSRLRPGGLHEERAVINIEGDPSHPISEGTLCTKGAAALQVVNNPRRLKKVLYRAPGGKAWEEKSWDWALQRIAARVRRRATRRSRRTVDGHVVNRTEAIACLGGSALDNEECYLLAKLMRALGLVYVEHQARL